MTPSTATTGPVALRSFRFIFYSFDTALRGQQVATHTRAVRVVPRAKERATDAPPVTNLPPPARCLLHCYHCNPYVRNTSSKSASPTVHACSAAG